MMKFLQRLGKSLMLPVAVLPVAAILMGIGYWIDPSGWGGGNQFAAFLIKAGSAILDHIPILFAVGIALGMSKKQDGAAAISGLVAFLVITTLLSKDTVAMLTKVDVEQVNAAFGKIDNAFVGIISGIIASICYDRFSGTQLPTFLAFFSGRRCVPIVTSIVMLGVSLIFFVIWPPVYGALVAFGIGMSKLGPLGAGLFGFFNRLLIPTGLHHALNSVFWFSVANIDDIGKFWGNIEGGVKGVTGMYQAGFFPIMMFGLPGAALAMYHTAKDNRKKVAASLLIAAAFTSFFTGVTEPIEFSFMFLAPLLYVIHAALTGISMAISAAFHWTAGFGFSAGFIDFFLSLRIPLANYPLMLLVQGAIFFVLYYLIFRFVIVKFNLKTPGREDDDIDVEAESKVALSGSNFAEMAKIILDGLGGKENIVSVDFCVTRLRLDVKDTTLINDKKIKSTGCTGVIKPSKTSAQVIVGTKVQFVYDELKKLL